MGPGLRALRCGAASLLIALTCPLLAFAYVDPGAGSMLLQLLLGGLAGALIFGRLLAKRIARFLGLGKEQDDT